MGGEPALQGELRDAQRRGRSGSCPDEAIEVAWAAVDSSPQAGLVIGIDAKHRPVVVVPVDAGSPVLPSIVLEYVRVEFAVQGQFWVEGKPEQVRATLFTLLDTRPDMVTMFAIAVGEVLADIDFPATTVDLDARFRQWMDFFQPGRKASSKFVGIVGEVATLYCLPNPEPWVEAWHEDPAASSDFLLTRTDEQVGVEVKASRAGRRLHRLRYPQAARATFAQGYVASVLVDTQEGKGTLRTLVELVLDRLPQERLRSRVWGNLAKMAGQELDDFLGRSVHISATLASVRLYRAESVPTLALAPSHPAVRDISYAVDFDLLQDVDMNATLAQI